MMIYRSVCRTRHIPIQPKQMQNQNWRLRGVFLWNLRMTLGGKKGGRASSPHLLIRRSAPFLAATSFRWGIKLCYYYTVANMFMLPIRNKSVLKSQLASGSNFITRTCNEGAGWGSGGRREQRQQLFWQEKKRRRTRRQRETVHISRSSDGSRGRRLIEQPFCMFTSQCSPAHTYQRLH